MKCPKCGRESETKFCQFCSEDFEYEKPIVTFIKKYFIRVPKYRLYIPDNAKLQFFQSTIKRCKKYSHKLNRTGNVQDFVTLFGNIEDILKKLSKYEKFEWFTNRPSDDLNSLYVHKSELEKQMLEKCFKKSLTDKKRKLAFRDIDNNINFFSNDNIDYINETSKTFNFAYHYDKVQTDIKENDLINYDIMEGHQFEFFCASILENNGFYNVEVTQGSGDHGIDILAEKNDISYAIQCKCYSSNIGNSAVQQAHTGKSLYHKDIAVVMTNQYFTKQAKEEAELLGVKLWDRNKIEELIDK